MRALPVFALPLLALLTAAPALPQPPSDPASASPPASTAPGSDPVLWPEAQRSFFQDGPGLLLTAEQRAEMRSLDEAGRDRFIEAFYKKTNGLREGITQRRRLADSLFASASDVRWKIAFLNGMPAERLIVDCGEAFQPSEVWTYHVGVNARSGKPIEHGVVVYRQGPGEPFRLWMPIDSKRALYTKSMEYWLEQWEELRGYISGARFDLQVCEDAVKKIDRATGVPGLTGAHDSGSGFTIKPIDNSSYLAAPKDLAAWAIHAAATKAPPVPNPLEVSDFEIHFPELQGQRMRVRALLQVPTKGLQTVDDSGKTVYALNIQGVVEQDGKPFEELRVRFRLPVPQNNEPLVLAVDRSLRLDKTFLLRLVVKDETSGAEARLARGFLVPSVAVPEPVAGNRGPPASGVAAANTGVLVPLTVQKGKDSPDPHAAAGRRGDRRLWRAEALVTGDKIKKVIFLVDGTAQLTRTTPPFSAEVRLARFPTEQTVRAEGYDEKSQLVAADEVVVNQPRGALGVWILDPPKGRRINSGKVLARAELLVPEGRRVDSLEFKVNDTVVTKLTKPPWQAEIEVPSATDLAYITVSATLDDGSLPRTRASSRRRTMSRRSTSTSSSSTSR